MYNLHFKLLHQKLKLLNKLSKINTNQMNSKSSYIYNLKLKSIKELKKGF